MISSNTAFVLSGLACLACGNDVTELLSTPPGAPAPALPAAAAPAPSSGARGQVVSLGPQTAVPSFLWATRGAAAIAPSGPRPSVEAAARSHVAKFAGYYGIAPAAAEKLELRDIHDTGHGAIIARFGRRIDGVEVFGEQIAVATDRDLGPVALAGYVTGSRPSSAAKGAAKAAASLDPARAVIAAIADVTRVTLDPSDLEAAVAAGGPYQNVALRASGSARAGITSREPARVKPVLFPLAGGQAVPAHYVETVLGDDKDGKPRAFSFVVGNGGKILWRKDLVAFDDALDAFSYRVYADDTGLYTPWDGPQGTASTPHPTGLLDEYQAPFLPAKLVTISSLKSLGINDRWLPPGATTTLGNNVDAYADIAFPDGFTPGADFRGAVTAPGVFDYVLNPQLDAASSQTQRMAGITQLFYDNNWFHDWYYAAGFTEAAGNAQFSNYGRGGVEGDALRAEAQDASGWNNANMYTPADGARPVMQMYGWNYGTSGVTIKSPPSLRGKYRATPASFTAQHFELAGNILRAEPPDACEPLAGAVENAIVLVDDGVCSELTKSQNAQAAGARGIIIAKLEDSIEPQDTWYPFDLPEQPLGIGVLTMNYADGERLREALAGGESIEGKLFRDSILRSGDVDNLIVAHEWGHYIQSRLIGDATGLDTNLAFGLGEGWADFHALLMAARPEDTFTAANANWNGVYAVAGYALGSFTHDPYYFGVRRFPYSTDLSKNPLTFQHISDDGALPDDVPNSGDGPHTEPHKVGEVWATMLWECYASLLRDTLGAGARLTFGEARDRMRDYLVAAYKLTPRSPTLLDARDALLAAALVNDSADHALFVEAFAKRGAGVYAVAPDRFDVDNHGVVESFSFGAAVVAASATLTDDVEPVCIADDSLDDGEAGSLRITFENVGNGATGGLSAVLSTTTAGVTFPGGATIAIPALPIAGSTVVAVPVMARGLSGLTTYSFAVRVGDAGAGAPAPRSFEFAGNLERRPYQSFTDGAESPHVVWSTVNEPQMLGPGWERLAIDGLEHAYHCSSVSQPSTQDLVSPSLVTTPGEPVSLSIRHRYSFETDDFGDYDGGVIELSRDGGSTWEDVGESAGYTGTLYPDSDNPLGGRAAFVRKSPDYPAFATLTLDVDPGDARSLMLRFRVASDVFLASRGWDIDAITLGGIASPPFDAIVAQPARCNATPLAVIGYNQSVTDTGSTPPFTPITVTLDGSASFDTDGDALTYRWVQLDGPPVDLNGAETNQPTFTAPEVPAGAEPVVLSFQLVVGDGTVTSAPAVTFVQVTDGAPPPLVDAGADTD